MKIINFSRGIGGSLFYFVEIPEGWGGGSSVPYKYGKSREMGGVLSEIPSVVGYGYFLESHNNIYLCFLILSFFGYRKTLVSDSYKH